MLTLLAWIGLNAAAGAQQSGGGTAPAQFERFCFSALDKAEKPVPGLTAQDFELRLNGRLSSLQGFVPARGQDDRSVPLVAWILIDFNPNVSAALIKRQAAAAGGIFRWFHPDSVVGIKLVSDRSETLAPLEHNPQALHSAFSQFSERRSELRVGSESQAVPVGPGGIARAIELAMNESEAFVRDHASLGSREIHRAIMILSDGNLNPSYKLTALYEKAMRGSFFLYPVFVPRPKFGAWIVDYFDLAKRTAGVASIFGALAPGSNPMKMPRVSLDTDALTFNFLLMARDLNGKYSFVLPVPTGNELRLDLKCRRKGVQIRLPRRKLP